MGIEGAECLESREWVNMPLDEIIMRHELLVKTGNYTMPDEKRPQLKLVRSENRRSLPKITKA